jgi:hypothetical protein
MNKINEIGRIYENDKVLFAKNAKIVKEIIKIYPFSADGSLKNLKFIQECFPNIDINYQ